MHTTLRRTIPLVASAALVSTALLASTGAALAAKPVPEISGAEKGLCRLSGDGTVYRTTVDLSANKGRWGFVTVTLDLEGLAPKDVFVKLENDIGQFLEVEAAAELPAYMTVTVTSRKGIPFTGPNSSVTTPMFCVSG